DGVTAAPRSRLGPRRLHPPLRHRSRTMSANHIRSAIAALALVPALSLSRPAPAPRVVTITAREYAFEGPGTIAAGTVTLPLVNRGAELHHVILFKLTQGKTFADLAALMKEPPQGPRSEEHTSELQSQ